MSAAGTAEGQTVNGSVSVSMGRAEGPLSFQTVNGSITVELPGDAAADVSAQTVNLGGVSFAPGDPVDFTFPDGPAANLLSGETVLVVRDTVAFASRFGAVALTAPFSFASSIA